MNYKIIALIGEAGSGKDTLMQKVLGENPTLHEIVSFTTRPPREGEIDGINYHFVTGEKFAEMVLDGRMIEASCFNNWFYGTGFDSLRTDAVNIGVFNPQGIDSLMAYGKEKIELYVYYVCASPRNRLLRQLNRELDPDVDEIIRRYHADLIDFEDLDFHYNEITNDTEFQLEFNEKIISAAVRALEAKIDKSI